MFKKFFPHFVGYEEDLKQEMMVALINSIKRIKRGEIRSQQNYIITHLKYETYKMAKKLIDYDKCTRYLEDFKPKGFTPDRPTSWENIFKEFGIVDIERIPEFFESYEERYMVMCILGIKGYRKDYLRAELKKADEEFDSLELEEKKKAIISLVDKNKLYVNYSDMDDESYAISESDKAFTKSFYAEV